MILKYGTWTIGVPGEGEVKLLRDAGYSLLTAAVLSARGCRTPEEAQKLLDAQRPLTDPFEMKEMDRAVAAIREALANKQKIAVFGDYDVDGITATCLLTDYLRSLGADCIFHIPGRIEEGYGLNAEAIAQLTQEGVQTIITVDCGITALAEAALCKTLGITLIVTDHHECKSELPDAAAVLDPHRPDATFSHKNLSGVGVAFKLAAALEGDQEAIAARYCDLVCLGTIADVMPLTGENRRLVTMGLAEMRRPRRMGLRALIAACDCGQQPITAATIGYVLAPRINAAGRMERAELAVRLFLSKREDEAAELAQTLCRLNRERQAAELEIYKEAADRLRGAKQKESAIVLAGENWHQGVIGIVASRLCEEFCRPTFLICLNGTHGKASSRSYGGFNLFAALNSLSPLLEGYGGHESAAGFTIARENIDRFRREICRSAEEYRASGQGAPTLDIDCELPAHLITQESVQGLAELEPCGTGCPKPVFCLSEVTIDRLSAVGAGKHLRLRLRAADGTALQAIFFSAGKLVRRLRVGDRVDVAFQLQINEYQGTRSVQLLLLDLRRASPLSLYERFCAKTPLSRFERAALAPNRGDITDVWRYLKKEAPNGDPMPCELEDLSLAVASESRRHSVRRTLACLEILAELHLIELQRSDCRLTIRVIPHCTKNPLENSELYRTLRGDVNGNLSGSL